MNGFSDTSFPGWCSNRATPRSELSPASAQWSEKNVKHEWQNSMRNIIVQKKKRSLVTVPKFMVMNKRSAMVEPMRP
jgi:hypothetical protein